MGEIIMRNSGNFEVIYQYFSTEITQFPETCYSPLLLYLQLFLSFLPLIIKSIYFYRFPHNQKTRILNKIKYIRPIYNKNLLMSRGDRG